MHLNRNKLDSKLNTFQREVGWESNKKPFDARAINQKIRQNRLAAILQVSQVEDEVDSNDEQAFLALIMCLKFRFGVELHMQLSPEKREGISSLMESVTSTTASIDKFTQHGRRHNAVIDALKAINNDPTFFKTNVKSYKGMVMKISDRVYDELARNNVPVGPVSDDSFMYVLDKYYECYDRNINRTNLNQKIADKTVAHFVSLLERYVQYENTLNREKPFQQPAVSSTVIRSEQVHHRAVVNLLRDIHDNEDFFEGCDDVAAKITKIFTELHQKLSQQNNPIQKDDFLKKELDGFVKKTRLPTMIDWKRLNQEIAANEAGHELGARRDSS